MVTRSRRMKIPSSAATTKPIWAIGTIRRATGTSTDAQQKPCCKQRECEPYDLAGCQWLAEQCNHQQDRDDKVQAKDRCVGADGARGQAADETKESDEDEGAGQRAPQR